jgi:hypothetical protein
MMPGERAHRSLEVGAAIALVGAEAEVAGLFGQRAGPRSQASRQTSTETSLTGNGSGGSGLAALTHTATAS